MPPELKLAVVSSVIGYLMLFHAGINGLIIAKLMRLGWAGYLWLGGVWLWISVMGSWGLWVTVNTILQYGRPMQIVYESGHIEPVVMAGRMWISLVGGFIVCAFLWVITQLVRKNLTKRTEAEKEAAGDLYREMTRLRRVL